MNTTLRIFSYQVRDVARSRWLAGYSLFFFAAAGLLLTFSGANAKALLGLCNVALLVIPLATMMFVTTYMYSSREFVELILAQPIARSKLYFGILLGLVVPLIAGFVAGLGVPLLFARSEEPGFAARAVSLLAAGSALTLCFTALGVCIASKVQDRLRGLVLSISIWLGLALVYDGFVLFVATVFSSYPLERAMIGLMIANPIDLARVALLLQFDISALMSYTGAVLRRFFTEFSGITTIAVSLMLWTAIPACIGLRSFRNRDF